MSTTSGRKERARRAPSSPSAASPTTSMSSQASRIVWKPARTTGWSSTMSTEMAGARARPSAGVERQAGREPEAAAVDPGGVETATEQLDPLRSPTRPTPAGGPARRERAVTTGWRPVDDGHGQGAVLHLHVDVGAGARRA